MPEHVVLAPIHIRRGMQTDFMGIDILTQTDVKKCYEISIQTDVVPELVKLRLLTEFPDMGNPKSSFIGVMQKGQKRRRMMSVIGSMDPDEIVVEDDDPFMTAQKELQKGLKEIRQSFSQPGRFQSSKQ
jgi:hypothetical protein